MNKFFQFNEFLELGKLFKKYKAYLIALEYFNKAITLSYLPINKQRLLEAYELRGNTKIFLNNYFDAILDYSKAIELDHKDPYLYFFRGYSYESLGLDKEAMKNFKISVQLDPDFNLALSMIDYLKQK